MIELTRHTSHAADTHAADTHAADKVYPEAGRGG